MTRPRGMALAVMALLWSSEGGAQVRPDRDWRTISSPHFRVHFTPELEHVARRAAAQAETAYVRLADHLPRPRGLIDLLISDDFDVSNGFAMPAPSNRIVVYATPPVAESSLRFTDDYLQLVIIHELVHIYHLDRVRGLWAILQKVFGRSPLLFVNGYQPRWMVEGLAVYYESLLTGSGRIEGSEHRMIARTAALEHTFPRIDQLSYVNPRFPYAYAAYAYGSLFMDYLGDKHGDSAVAAYVHRASGRLLPWDLNSPARKVFGRGLTAEFRAWAASLAASQPSYAAPMPRWENLTVDGVYASFPRWLDDSSIIYTGTPGRESYAAWKLTMRDSARGRGPLVTRQRIARRHTPTPHTRLADGSLIYSELEYTGPFTVRSDLYVDDRRGRRRRLTVGERLSAPDARRDGTVVAMQVIPGGTRLVLRAPDGTITPITSGGLDEQWAEPRWSPDGRHIAAIRWTRGGTSSVVVLDPAGRVVHTLVRERVVNATPGWSPDGAWVYFSSDRTGITNLYRMAFSPGDSSTPVLQQVSDAQTGLFQPQPSPNGRDLAAVVFRADGYHIGRAPMDGVGAERAADIPGVVPRGASAAPASDAPARRYSPWRMLLPTSWMPFYAAGLTENSARIGALVSGHDIAGRHAYQALLFVPTDNSGLTGVFQYRNATLGQPLIDVAADQEWSNLACVADASQQNLCVGDLRRRIRDAAVSLTFQRPRMRTYAYMSVGTGLEVRDYATDPAHLIGRIDSLYLRAYYYPRVMVSAGWSNVQYPLNAISAEDGVALAITSRQRWRWRDTLRFTSSVVGSASAYKSLALPGYAHHVLALNAAAGIQDNRATSYFEVGGISGGVLDVFPGYVLGEGRRTFGVRGFDPGAQLGISAFKASAEYRAPLTMPGRGLGTLPLFFDRTSLSVFGDAGTAWCPGIFVTRPAPYFSRCTRGEADAGIVFTEPKVLASAGAELNLSAAILSWDVPYRFRLGAAFPLAGQQYAYGRTKPMSYLTVGASF